MGNIRLARGRPSPDKSASVYQCDCWAGFRLSPTCSPIRYGLIFPRNCLFIGIVNDKGRYHSIAGEMEGRISNSLYPEYRFGILLASARHPGQMQLGASHWGPSAAKRSMQCGKSVARRGQDVERVVPPGADRICDY